MKKRVVKSARKNIKKGKRGQGGKELLQKESSSPRAIKHPAKEKSLGEGIHKKPKEKSQKGGRAVTKTGPKKYVSSLPKKKPTGGSYDQRKEHSKGGRGVRD